MRRNLFRGKSFEKKSLKLFRRNFGEYVGFRLRREELWKKVSLVINKLILLVCAILLSVAQDIAFGRKNV